MDNIYNANILPICHVNRLKVVTPEVIIDECNHPCQNSAIGIFPRAVSNKRSKCLRPCLQPSPESICVGPTVSPISALSPCFPRLATLNTSLHAFPRVPRRGETTGEAPVDRPVAARAGTGAALSEGVPRPPPPFSGRHPKPAVGDRGRRRAGSCGCGAWGRPGVDGAARRRSGVDRRLCAW